MQNLMLKKVKDLQVCFVDVFWLDVSLIRDLFIGHFAGNILYVAVNCVTSAVLLVTITSPRKLGTFICTTQQTAVHKKPQK